MTDPKIGELLAGGPQRQFLEDMRRDLGYPTENVVPLTADDAMGPWLESIVWATRADHEHNAYGWAGCSMCRRVAAHDVSNRFPPPL